MAILERSYVLELQELLLSPKAHWCTKATIPCPEPFTASKEMHCLSACWAPDDSAVLLQYQLQDWQDARAGWSEEGYFEVRAVWCPADLLALHPLAQTSMLVLTAQSWPTPACVGW